MALLGRVMYDPTVPATHSTSSNTAMTAMDTTNLRVNFTVPASGKVFVVMRGQIDSSLISSAPQILIGVLEGSTIRGRVVPRQRYGGQVATSTRITWTASFVVTGLTPSANLNWDLAYGVETGVSPSTTREGGGNDAVAATAWGACSMEIRGA